MTPEQQFFLDCLRDMFAGRITEKPLLSEEPDIGLDPAVLYHISEGHSLSGVVYAQCMDWLRADSNFQHSFLSDVALSANRKYLLKEIGTKFLEEGIPFICMKGSIFRDYWPIPELREMGDMDLVIRHRDREKSDQIMMDLGYRKMVDNHAVWTYWMGPFMFELHDVMFYEELANRFDYRKYFQRVWDTAVERPVSGVQLPNMYVPEDNLHFLYLMAHTAKHIINKGSGFRAYLDMIYYCRNQNLDWKYLEKELAELQLLDFTRTCFSLCERWFGVKMPLSQGNLENGFYETVTMKTFHDGIFGLENREENHGASSAKAIKRAHLPYWLRAVTLSIQRLFPPYSVMQLTPWYSWIDGKPWLLPAAWVYRWCYVIAHKRNEGMALLKEPFTEKDIIEKRESLISDWGL